MTIQDIYAELVIPVCALEEYCNCAENNASAMVEVISMALRKVLNDMDETISANRKDGIDEV